MLKKFDKILVGLLPEKETALLAVSGGADSICMAEGIPCVWLSCSWNPGVISL